MLTDNGTVFSTSGNICSAAADLKLPIENGESFWANTLEYACTENGIDHRPTKPRHPWTNGRVERMNRTVKDAPLNRFHYDTHEQLRPHQADFVTNNNFTGGLKIPKGLTSCEAICKAWKKEPGRLNLNPILQMVEVNIQRRVAKSRTSSKRLE